MRRMHAAAVLFLCFFSTVFAYDWSTNPGDGSAGNPYQISTADQLMSIGSSYTLLTKNYILIADIDLGGLTLSPIGNNSAQFNGFFDGNSHVIFNTTFLVPNSDRIGLFGYIGTKGRVENLEMTDVNITGRYYVGGMCGRNSGIIKQCYITGTITGNANVGGLCGENHNTISQCYTITNVTGSNYNAGGLCGYNDNTISLCYTSGNTKGVSNIGGLCGRNEKNINQCYTTGMSEGSSCVGGLCGKNDSGTISQSYATGGATGGSDIGGLCGMNYNGTITLCYASGIASGNSVSYTDAGGLCGYNSGTVFQCYATGTATGKMYAGGLCGRNVVAGVISQCYAEVVAVATQYAGGLCGGNSAIINQCYAKGGITATQYAGGLCGYNSAAISQCYATGAVSKNTYFGGLCGYQSGSTAKIEDCFWDTETSDIPTGYNQDSSNPGTITNVSGKTTTEMMAEANFIQAGWDFSSVDGDIIDWIMVEVNYPHLIWEIKVDVPDIIGQSHMDAVTILADLGFMVKITYATSKTIPAGVVISQFPESGTSLTCESTINLTVSLGPLGNGTIQDPYRITTKSDLLTFAALPTFYNGYFILMSDIDLTGETFTAAVIAPGTNNSSQGFQGTAFTGVFDGNGHTISNLTITGPENTYVGFFGRVGSGGVIQNLGLVNADVQGESYVGGLCGSNENGSIYNCHATGMVAGNGETGGLCGYSKGTFNQCSFSGIVSGMRSESSVGGFCGWNEGSIGQCYAAGTVAGYETNIGGICGINGGGTISQCYSKNTVVGIGVSACAGICSFNVGVIHQSYACGPIGGTHLLGGLCIENIGTITDSFWDIESSMCTVSDGGRGLTSEEMKQSWSFKGWTDGTWTIDEWMDSGPHLGWENYAGMPIMIDYDPPTYMGDGTQENPFQIANADDLICLGKRTPDWDKQFVLVNNIDLSGVQFAHAIIGEGGGSFTGVFDGKSHVIRNLTIEERGTASTGLFYKIGSGGQLKNLGLVNVDITGNYRVGGLSGINSGGTIQCYVTGTVAGNSDVGGLCGYNMCYLAQCFVRGKVTGSGSNIGGLCGKNYNQIWQCYAANIVTGSEYVGGLCGYIEDDGLLGYCFWDIEIGNLDTGYNLSPYYSKTICNVEGKTTAEMKISSTFTDAGWDFLGETENGTEDIWGMKSDTNDGYPYLVTKSLTEGDGSMENPYQISTAEELIVLSKNSSLWDKCFILVNDIDMSAYAGMQYNIIGNPFEPFTGIFDGQGHKISNLFHIATVDNYSDLGGLFGYIQEATIKNLGLENVYFTGDITVGGLAGNQYGGSIDNCYSTGVIGSYYGGGLVGSLGEGIISNSYSRSSVNSEWGGGLVGVQYGGVITGCFSQGSVTSMAALESRVGGLVGRQEYGDINNCYSMAAIEFNGTEFSGFAGGLAGETMGSIVNCYSIGTITGSGDPNLTGGLVGNGSDVVHSVWDVQSSGLDHSSGGIGKTTAEMKTLSIFTSAGWDFSDTWAICEGTNYPRLQWQIPTLDFACPDGVNVEDLEFFVGRWLADDCTSTNDYCGGADLDGSGIVNMEDWVVFSQHWLEM